MIDGAPADSRLELVQPNGVANRLSTQVLATHDGEIAKAFRFMREHACEGINVSNVAEQCLNFTPTTGTLHSANRWLFTAEFRPIWAPEAIRRQIGRLSQIRDEFSAQDSCAIKGMGIQDSVDSKRANQKRVELWLSQKSSELLARRRETLASRTVSD